MHGDKLATAAIPAAPNGFPYTDSSGSFLLCPYWERCIALTGKTICEICAVIIHFFKIKKKKLR